MIITVVNGIITEAESVIDAHIHIETKHIYTPSHTQSSQRSVNEKSILTDLMREVFTEMLSNKRG